MAFFFTFPTLNRNKSKEGVILQGVYHQRDKIFVLSSILLVFFQLKIYKSDGGARRTF